MTDHGDFTTTPGEFSPNWDELYRTSKRRRMMQKRLSRLVEEATGELSDGSHNPQTLLTKTHRAMRIARLEMDIAKADLYFTVMSNEICKREESMKDAKLRFASASLHWEEHSRLLQMLNSLIPKLSENDDHGAPSTDVVHAMFQDHAGPDRKWRRAALWRSQAAAYYGMEYYVDEWRGGKEYIYDFGMWEERVYYRNDDFMAVRFLLSRTMVLMDPFPSTSLA